MSEIDLLEHGGGGAAIRLDGMIWNLADPREHNYQWVLLVLSLGRVPGTPVNLPYYKHEAIFPRWCAAWDLPSFEQARRLTYLVDHYRGALVHDLLIHAGLDLGELWRARRWTTLLDVIDRLPGHSHYSAAVANDEEHAKLVAEAIAARKQRGDDQEDKGPALTGWTPEVAVMTQVLDAVNSVRYAVIAVQSGKKGAGEPPKPARRPVTALERAMRVGEFNRRKAVHEALVARVLPHKAAVKT